MTSSQAAASNAKTYSCRRSKVVPVFPFHNLHDFRYTPIGGQDLDKPLPYNPRDPVKKQVESSLQKSLENLKTTYLDSYLLHSPLKTMEYTLEAWRALMALQDEGKIRKIGVSNVYDVAIIHALSHERQVQVVQNRWYEGNQWDRRVFNYCREHQIQYQWVVDIYLFLGHFSCFHVLYRSFWTLTGSPSLLKHPTLLDLAKELKCTPAQAVYKLAQSEGIIPLSGTTDRVHMEEGVATHKIDFSNELVKSVKALIEGGIEV